MKKLTIMVLLLTSVAFAQRQQFGEAFEFDDKGEIDPHFVLADNYNYYLMTASDEYKTSFERYITMRKFDQNNKMIDAYKYKLPKLDQNALYEYLGYSELGGKLTVFTQSYWGKGKKNALYKHEFDKSTNTFNSTEIFNNPIESNNKSGNAYLQKSDNGRFVAVGYIYDRPKQQPEKVMIMMLDATTNNVIWQKEFSFADENYTKEFAVTNSGKVVFHRFVKGWKKQNFLVLASADMQEDKQFGADLVVHDIKAISIGSQDYIVAFNYPNKTVRGGGDFSNLMLYDLQGGRIINNIDINEFGPVKDLRDVQITNTAVQGNEIHVFAEGRTETVTKPTPGAGGMGGFPEQLIKYGPASLIVLNTDGTLKTVKKLNYDENAKAPFYHSFGLLNVKGAYWVNGGMYQGLYPLTGGTFDRNPNNNIRFIDFEPLRYSYNHRAPEHVNYVTPLMHYFPDTNKVIFARIVNDPSQPKMNIVQVGL